MQQYDSNTFLWLPSCLNATNYIDICNRKLPLTSLLWQHFLLARNRKEVVFYFLARIPENVERESRRKKVKNTPQELKWGIPGISVPHLWRQTQTISIF